MTTDIALFAGLFFSALTSATILPGTSEAALGALVAKGDHAVWLLVMIATAGNVIGSIINWALGLYIDRFRDRRWFPVSGAALDRAARWFSKYGLWSLLLAWLRRSADPVCRGDAGPFHPVSDPGHHWQGRALCHDCRRGIGTGIDAVIMPSPHTLH